MNKSLDMCLRSWALALLAIAVVAVLSIRQIDKFMFSYDSLHSFLVAGMTAEGKFSPEDVIHTLEVSSPDQGPFYYLILNQWGKLVGDSIALARVLTIFCALLSFAMIYRLASDALAPAAGAFAVIIAASNAFYAFYLAHIRFYPLLVLLSTLVIWLYLRIAEPNRDGAGRRVYVGLCFTCFALVTTHAYGFLIYIVLSLYHLFFVHKDRRWLAVVATAAFALTLAYPLLITMLTSGVEFAKAGHGPNAQGLADVFRGWLEVTANGSPLLILVSVAGFASGWRQIPDLRRCAAWFALLLGGICLLAGVSGIMRVGLVRHLLPAMPIAVLFIAAGLYALYLRRRSLALLLLPWILTGMVFAMSADWPRYLQSRLIAFQQPPWHLINRVTQQSGERSRIFSVRLSQELVNIDSCCTHSLRRHWFTARGTDLTDVGNAEDLDKFWGTRFDSVPFAWLVFDKTKTGTEEFGELDLSFRKVGFRACETVDLPSDIVMVKYSWITLDCQPPAPATSSKSVLIDHEFFGLALDSDTRQLYQSDQWTARRDFDSGNYRMSYQLISEDWRNVAQLDLPLVAENELRQYAIDISGVSPGQYRLMLVLYDRFSGVRLAWEGNEEFVPEMLHLDDVSIGEI